MTNKGRVLVLRLVLRVGSDLAGCRTRTFGACGPKDLAGARLACCSVPAAAFGSGAGFRSSSRRLNTASRNTPSSVTPPKLISATITGLSQVALGFLTGTESGEFLMISGSSL
jgi:hypothetical protein